MMDRELTPTYKGICLFVGIIATLLLLLSSLIIAGWVIESPLLSRLGSAHHSMNLNVAICFFIAAFAIFALLFKRQYLAIGLALLLILIPMMTLRSYWVLENWHLGHWLPISENFIKEFDVPMDLSTGIGLILSGFALTILAFRVKWLMTIAIVLGSLITSIGLIGLILMSNNFSETSYKWLSYITTNAHTSLFLIVLGFAIMALTIYLLRELSIILRPLHILIPLALLFYITSFGLYSALLIQKNANAAHTMKLAISWMEKDIQRDLNDTSKRLQNIATALESLALKQENAKQYATFSLNLQTGFDAVAMLNSSKEILWEAWATNNTSSDLFKNIHNQTIPIRIANPALNQYGFMFVSPFINGDTLLAYKTDLQLFHDAITDLHLSGYDVDLTEANGESIHRSTLPPGIKGDFNEHEYSSRINLDDVNWDVKIKPSLTTLSQVSSYFPEIALGLGLILSTLALASTLLYLTTKENQIKAQKVEKRLETLIQTLLDGIITTNEKKEIVGWNGGAEQIFGYKREEVVGQSVFMLIPRRYRKKYEEEIDAVLKDEKVLNGKIVEVFGARKSGEEFPLEASVSTWKTNGETYSTGIVRDITDRKILEDSLRHSTAMAEKSNQIKSEFLAKMSHEMRTPLTSIIGYSELMLAPEVNVNEYPFFINIIQSNGKHLLGLITDILDLTGIESNTLKVDHIKCSPQDIVNDVVAALSSFASRKGLTVEVDTSKNVPPFIFTDPKRVFQILYKLLHNAIKFTEKGIIKVTISNPNKNKVPTTLQFIVVDPGIGISKEIGKDLFNVLSASDSSFVRKIGGSGIALAVAKKLAELLGGGISYYSEEQRGSTFVLTIATGLTTELMESNLSTIENKSQPSETSMEIKILNNRRILIAEDNQDTQRLIALSLKYAGANVEAVANGQQALQKGLDALETGDPYDVILMDIEMPEMSGIEATQKLRSAGYVAPILALTAFATKEESDKCVAAGCNEVIIKPVDREHLIQKLNSYSAG